MATLPSLVVETEPTAKQISKSGMIKEEQAEVGSDDGGHQTSLCFMLGQCPCFGSFISWPISKGSKSYPLALPFLSTELKRSGAEVESDRGGYGFLMELPAGWT